jgi:hypothetical protein
MDIVYSATKGHKSKEIEELVARVLPSYLQSLGYEINVFLYNPSGPHDTGSFDEIVEKILQADMFIAEMSRASQTLGFQLSFALANTKPSLYLYHTGTKSEPGSILRNNPSRLLKIKDYDKLSYGSTLDSFVRFASQQQQTVRTSFMSTRKIDDSIQGLSQGQGVSKGEIIRQLLTEAINKPKQS